MTVAQTILEQLGGSCFIAMTGAKSFIDHGKGLSFKIGRNCKNVNQVKITLNALDLYDMEFGKKRGVYHRHTSAENIDADNLQRVFTMHTGMDTHL